MSQNKPTQGDSHIIHLGWDNTSGWDSQIAIANITGQIQTRAQNAGVWSAWRTVQFTDVTNDFDTGWSNNSTRNNIKFKVGSMHWCNDQNGNIVGEAWRGSSTYTNEAPFIELTSGIGYLAYETTSGSNGIPNAPYMQWDSSGVTLNRAISYGAQTITANATLEDSALYIVDSSSDLTLTLPSLSLIRSIKIAVKSSGSYGHTVVPTSGYIAWSGTRINGDYIEFQAYPEGAPLGNTLRLKPGLYEFIAVSATRWLCSSSPKIP